MSTATAEAGLTVQTSEGPVRGRVLGDTRSWRGIPYAEPPVAELRLRLPRRARPWSDVLDASGFGPWAPQRIHRLLPGAGPRTPMSEDCLTINVTAPKTPSADPLPVLVFLHGGAFEAGSAAMDLVDGSGITAMGNVLFVSMNYRLGALGFMDFRAYSTPDRPFEANLGLADQVAALEWVQRNIAAFGGDPGNVTLFGQSAGATSALTLMCVPAAAGLFHRAFLQSPAAGVAYSPERTEQWAAEFLGILGVGAGGAAEALSELPAAALVEAAGQLSGKIVPEAQPGARSLAPVVDGTFLPVHPLDAFADGSAQRIPLVLGTMESEGTLFDRFHDVLPTSEARIEKMFALTEPGLRDGVVAAYKGYPHKKQAVELGGDAVFWHPGLQVLQAHSEYAPAWCYRFDYAPRAARLAGLGATHGFDLPAVFGTYGSGAGRALLGLGNRRTTANVGHRFQSALLRFAKSGAPGPMWPKYDTVSRRTKIFDRYDRIELDPRSARRKAWNGYRGYR
ncbi:carboxylesterase/lipase family protein [Arthrobacter sp. Sa2CUA1]|uniref:Carboxylic ester hydrolase n=1 Tax=Arthrobacter gallicola TaxID=2762225 RepID=A0ABR8UNB5_9MICC|nr:carboxylesterase/lipase family protein [Arthrobacter gallicola]MBD7994023.1 carboxylesterase/lipase family protein [Arthrobacter gallicola]